jgi:decaprenyl-phosphate phosphoribosyltransferase
MLLALLQAIRPKQWVKNGFLFAPLVFSKNLFHGDLLLRSATAFGLFCAVASAVYLGNDVLDAAEDRRHPVKRNRPVASGRLPAWLALAAAAVLAVGGIWGAFSLAPAFAYVLLVYLVLNVGYSLGLKRIAYVDVGIIASGFVLRVLGGALAIDVQASFWLFVCTFCLATFLALGKRKHEMLVAAAGGDKARTRHALGRYDLVTVDRALLMAGTSAVWSYVLYTIAPETRQHFNTLLLALTVPFPAFGVFRFMSLVDRSSRASSPTEALITDGPFVTNMAVWLAAVVAILYWAANAAGIAG